ncbi:MAG: GNAT family N-acetyltransferase [Candidatus Hydrogenedentes bacterium]|nr:GNAT family N-acetyltransferase [Candidatus Hydrogenedentota bacterium]
MRPKTERLNFRPYRLDDLDRLSDWFQDPVMMQYYGGLRNRQETLAWIERLVRAMDDKGYGYWVLELAGGDESVGHCGIADQTVDGAIEPEVGYLLQRDYWGHGYASEAAAALYEYALTDLGHDRIISIIDPGNTASIRVAERNGLEYERTTVWREHTVFIYAKHKD